MALSRKHYRLIAHAIKDNTSDDKNKRFNGSRLYKYSLIEDLCVIFARDNNLFSRDRFEDACNDE